MKKKILMKSTGVFLTAAILFTSVPVAAAEKGDAAIEEICISEEEACPDALEETEDYGSEQVTDIYSLDWKNAENNEIDHILGNTDWTTIGGWLKSLSEEELEELLKRDTVLNKETYIEECTAGPSSENEDELELIPEKTITALYYQYAMEKAETERNLTRAAFKSSTGYYQIMFVKGNETCIFQTKLSGLDAGVGSSKAQKATIAVTKKSGSNFVNFWQNAGSYNTTGGTTSYTLRQNQDSGGYYMLSSRLGFTKPAGYTATYEKVLASNTNTANPYGGECRLYYYDEGNWATAKRQYSNNNSAAVNEKLVSNINVLHHAGLGTGSNVVNNCFKIVLTPVTYRVEYNGNGATGGGVAAQNCTYDVAYNYQPNNFIRQYTVTYDGAGGQADVANHTVNYAFKGWNSNKTAAEGVAAGTSFSNAAFINGETVQLYATWKAASVILPKAVRTGYQLTGWSTSQGTKAAGTVYTPNKTETVKANWQANSYQVNYYDGISVKEKGTQKMTYGTEESLQTLKNLGISRPGYTFTGWNSSLGTYGDGEKVSNLTAINKGIVMMTAVWSANHDTPYKVRRYVQKTSGNTDLKSGYKLYEGKSLAGEETFYGTTDSTVTVPAASIEGYVTPDDRMVKIAGDGSTIAEFYYNLKTGENRTEEKPGGNVYTNNYGLSGEQVQAILSAMNTGSDATLTIDGIQYTIVKNHDGTLSIKLADMGNADAITIPEEITIGGKTYAITEIYKECFKNNTRLKEVTIGSNITSVGDSAFEGCTSLTAVKMPSNLQTIGNSAFMNCSALKTVTFNEGLLKIGNKAFYNCKALLKVKIPKSVLTIGSYGFGNCTKLKAFTFETDSSLLSMGKGIFSNCTSLKKVKMPEKLTAVPNKAFYNCKSLSSVKIAAAVTKIGSSAFEKCKALTTVVIPKRVQIIGKKAFYNCKKLKKVTIQSKALTAVGAKAFKQCKKGIKFKLPGSKKEAYEKLLKGKH